ncbi:hypothetical protein TheetDRAFT_3060 [Thermoanaerobacter ethanolicus JW 200]|nr:hypothetical protein TheetDRAFT_3060 [Thermoanaerobacter ethanolicus JW 200]
MEKKIFDYEEKNEKIILKSKTNGTNCFYISVNSDMDGASTTLIHLKRKGFKNIYKEFYNWLKNKYIKYSQDKDLESLLNKKPIF